jgi:hypothetical protein
MRIKTVLFALAVVIAPSVSLAGTSGFREIEREMKEDFQRAHPCPSNGKTIGNCPGYAVGYILHPRNGGSYAQGNMRWMRLDEYEKTRQEHSPSS